MKTLKQGLAFGSALVLLAGCATHQWAPGPNAQGTFDEAKGRCQLMANNSGGGFAASGSPQFVASAAAGAAIGQAIKNQNNFNSCMEASGWVVDDPKPGQTPAVVEQLKAQALAAKSEADLCIKALRDDPKYQAIVVHLADSAVGHYTFAQMADTAVPTPEEATLLATFEDKADVCRTTLVNKITAIAVPAGTVLKDRMAKGRAIVLLLVDRKISWGEYARRVQALVDGQVAARS